MKYLKSDPAQGADAFYSGSLSDSILKEMTDLGADWVKEDLTEYTAEVVSVFPPRLHLSHVYSS